MWYMHDVGGWWMWIGGAGMFLFWGALVGLTIWAVARFTKRDRTSTSRTPLDAAKERYARGEIGKQEYDEIRKDLTG